MRFTLHNASTTLLVTLLGSLMVPPAQAGKGGGGGGGNPGYSLVRLVPPNLAIKETRVLELNEQGNVVGTFEEDSGASGSFYYNQTTGSYQLLGDDTSAFGINNSDRIVGEDNALGLGLYWSSPLDSNPTPLNPLTDHTHSRAYCVNNAGIIAGASYNRVQAPTAGASAIVVWRVNAQDAVSQPLTLPYPEGDLRGGPNDLTEQSNGITIIVGSTGDATNYPLHAVQWSVFVDGDGNLSLLSGPTVLSGDYAAAYGINAAGDVVGAASLDGGPHWPCVMSPGQDVLSLDGLPKVTWGDAGGINDGGKIVGSFSYLSARGLFIDRAVLWVDPGTAVDLNSEVSLAKGETLEYATRINTRGDIIASSGNGSNAVGCLLIAR
jgi:hypothetical protein